MSERPLIHVVDDDDSLRAALVRLLAAGGFETREYASAGDFLLDPPPDRPGCVLLDLRMPGPSGLDLQEALLRQGNGLPVIFLTGHADVPSSVRAMKSGAVDFLDKPVGRDTLFEAVCRAVARDLERRSRRDEVERLRALFASLTRREREVLELVLVGKLNKQIAGQLGISERTVKVHRGTLMEKLQVGTAAELGGLAERLRALQDGASKLS